MRSWPSPRPDDDGISLLADTLLDVASRHLCIGAMLGLGTDSCPYLISGFGPGGYGSIIMGPT